MQGRGQLSMVASHEPGNLDATAAPLHRDVAHSHVFVDPASSIPAAYSAPPGLICHAGPGSGSLHRSQTHAAMPCRETPPAVSQKTVSGNGHGPGVLQMGPCWVRGTQAHFWLPGLKASSRPGPTPDRGNSSSPSGSPSRPAGLSTSSEGLLPSSALHARGSPRCGFLEVPPPVTHTMSWPTSPTRAWLVFLMVLGRWVFSRHLEGNSLRAVTVLSPLSSSAGHTGPDGQLKVRRGPF